MSLIDKFFNRGKDEEEQPDKVGEELENTEQSKELTWSEKQAIVKIDGMWYNKATGEPVGEAGTPESKKFETPDAPDEPELEKTREDDDDTIR